jgi:hypothetical protein
MTENSELIIREFMHTPEDSLRGPDALSLPGDLVNWGRPCVDCGSRNVVIQINEPGSGFEKIGPLCYRCLLTRCGAARRFPCPIDEDLLDQLELDLGVLPGPKVYFMFPEIPRL